MRDKLFIVGIVFALFTVILVTKINIDQKKEYATFIKKLNKIHQEQLYAVKNHTNLVIQNNINLEHMLIMNLNDTCKTIFIYVDFPVCTSCFINVIKFIKDYSLKQNMNVCFLSEEKNYIRIKRRLIFENCLDMKIRVIGYKLTIPTKISLFLVSEDKNIFHLPLPEQNEKEFLKSFLR